MKAQRQKLQKVCFCGIQIRHMLFYSQPLAEQIVRQCQSWCPGVLYSNDRRHACQAWSKFVHAELLKQDANEGRTNYYPSALFCKHLLSKGTPMMSLASKFLVIVGKPCMTSSDRSPADPPSFKREYESVSRYCRQIC